MWKLNFKSLVFCVLVVIAVVSTYYYNYSSFINFLSNLQALPIALACVPHVDPLTRPHLYPKGVIWTEDEKNGKNGEYF